MARTTLEEVRDRFRRIAAGGPMAKGEAPLAKLRRTGAGLAVPPVVSPGKPVVDPGRTYSPRRTPRYTLTADRDDAILAFSAHKGKKVSELAATTEGQGFLRWISAQEFGDWPQLERDELQTLAKAYLGDPIDGGRR